MATGTMTRANGDEYEGGTITLPQAHSIGAMAESQRATAEIQAALTVAAARPRDEKRAVERIENACQRPGLAEKAEYVYSRGGSDITGPTIDLLTVIANCWGNIQFGFRELSQRNGESEVETFAWDLESNSKRTVVFTVPHKRFTRSGSTPLKDPRDIYELVANNAQRRVRACLEAIIPPDVVEDAVNQCRATLSASAEVTPDAIKKLLSAFEKFGVTKEQVEKRIARRIDTMQPAQLVRMRQIYKSINDGMSQPAEWFEVAETKPETAESLRDKLAKKAAASKAAPEPPPAPDESHQGPAAEDTDQQPAEDGDAIDYAARFAECRRITDVTDLKSALKSTHPNDIAAIENAAAARLKEIKDSRSS